MPSAPIQHNITGAVKYIDAMWALPYYALINSYKAKLRDECMQYGSKLVISIKLKIKKKLILYFKCQCKERRKVNLLAYHRI